MNRHESKAKFIAIEVIKNNIKNAQALNRCITYEGRLAIMAQNAVRFERIKQVRISVPASCFKKDSIGIDKRRYRRHLRKKSGVTVKINVQSKGMNLSAWVLEKLDDSLA